MFTPVQGDREAAASPEPPGGLHPPPGPVPPPLGTPVPDEPQSLGPSLLSPDPGFLQLCLGWESDSTFCLNGKLSLFLIKKIKERDSCQD